MTPNQNVNEFVHFNQANLMPIEPFTKMKCLRVYENESLSTPEGQKQLVIKTIKLLK